MRDDTRGLAMLYVALESREERAKLLLMIGIYLEF
jgi:hypothetical protein